MSEKINIGPNNTEGDDIHDGDDRHDGVDLPDGESECIKHL